MQATSFYLLLSAVFFQYTNGAIIVPKNPPEPWQAALMARYVNHNTDWVSLATISSQESIKSYPYVSLKSFTDGPKLKSTGIPFLYMTDMDVSGKDVLSDNRVSLMTSLAETDYCKSQKYDPQDPRCAKVLMTGKLVRIEKASKEYSFGLDALFDVHPAMKYWPTDHQFYLAKVDLQKIDVLDNFGGIKHVDLKDYYHSNVSSIINEDVVFSDVSVVELDSN